KGDTETIDDASSTQESSSGSKEEDKEIVEEDEKEDPKHQESQKEVSYLFITLWISISLVIILLLAVIFYISKRRIQLNRFKKSLKELGTKQAIPKIFSYTMTLLH